MSEAKFTPGPWCLFPIETGWIVNQVGAPGYVCTLPSVSHRAAECAANARLIAAAPDLLEACKQAEAWLSGWASAEPYLSIIRAAIAKAAPESIEPTKAGKVNHG